MKIGNVIKALRDKAGFSQKEFAEACSLSASYLSQIENNTRFPHESTLKEIANVLGIPVAILFFLTIGEEDVPEPKREAFQIIFPSVKSLITDLFPVTEVAID